jgi:hypothetical protein
MAKRRKITTVTLTPEQRERLERLWVYYGNYGPNTTSGNHSFIQRFLEKGIPAAFKRLIPRSIICCEMQQHFS